MEQFSPYFILLIVALYFGLLIAVSWLTTRRSRAGADTFYLGGRRTPWYIIAFGMVGSSISGVTFISVPGMVGGNQFSYIQMVLGFMLGYVVVAQVLLPLYYRLNLTSIYTYLLHRFGNYSYKTGASFFLISRLLGSAIRLLVVAVVLQTLVFDRLGIPFAVNVVLTVLLIFAYTHKGGIRTIIWTDTLQTAILLGALVLSMYFLCQHMHLSVIGAVHLVHDSDWSQIFFFDDVNDKRYFFKQFIAGVFTTITMTGLDQDLMQKNLSCRNLRDAKRNMQAYGLAFLPVNLLFLSLGVLLYTFMAQQGIAIPHDPDTIFPLIATGGYLPAVVGVLFIVGVIAAAYSSADSALAALTTSFTIDILGLKDADPRLAQRRRWVHLAMSVAFILLIIVFKAFDNHSIITIVYQVAGYTYGPLLGLFAFGLLTKLPVCDKYVPVVAVLSPLLTLALSLLSPYLLGGYHFGYELLIFNGLFTFVGLLVISHRPPRVVQ